VTEPSFGDYISAALRKSYAETAGTAFTCLLCGQPLPTHDQAACDAKMAAWQPTGFRDELDLIRSFGYVEVPHELLVDSGGHTCDATCLALYGNAYQRTPPPLPWHTRVRYALRRARWRLARLGGLRLVHRDRIDQGPGRRLMGRPRRRVLTTVTGYVVEHEQFASTDPTLTRHVAAELDRVDPLVCTHEAADLIEVTAISDSDRVYLRTCCGETVREQERDD
jgi:hypothetical protein